MQIKFWGVRGSVPTPTVKNMKTGGNTSCVEVRTCDNHIIVFDAGTGIIPLGESLLQEFHGKKMPSIHLFLSHTHWDHIDGFVFFKLLFQKNADIYIYGPQYTDRTVHQLIMILMDEYFCPIDFDTLPANIKFHDIPEGEITISDCTVIKSQKHNHPGGAYSYRVDCKNKSFVFHTDIEHSHHLIEQAIIEFSQNADLMVHDAQYTKEEIIKYKGWGHSTWQQAVEIAQKANVKMLGFTHHNPSRTDVEINKLEKQAKKQFENSFFCRESLLIEL